MNRNITNLFAITITILIIFLSLTACRGPHIVLDPALDVSNAAETQFDDEMTHVIIGGVKFENWELYTLAGDTDREVFDYAGEVVSYFINDDHYVFYCTAEGLEPDQWLIKVPDNGKSKLLYEEAFFIHAEGVDEVPEWLELHPLE